MYASASFREMPRFAESPNALMPYTMPKLTALALLRASRVTSFGGTARVDVFALLKCLDQHGVLGHMSKQAEFNLRVIRDDQLPAIAGNKRGADFASQLRLDRDILQRSEEHTSE